MIRLLLALWLLIPPALASRGSTKSAPPPPSPDGPLVCNPQQTETSQGYTGYAIRASAELALAAAREEAHRRARADLQCLDASTLRCAAGMAQIHDGETEQRARPDGKVEACAHTNVRRDALAKVEVAIRQIDAEIDALVAAVPSGLRVAVPAPLWESGCDGGRAGRSLHQRVINLLREQGAPPSEGVAGADATLLLTLARDGESVSLNGRLTQDGTSTLLGGTTFQASLYNIGPTDHQTCMLPSRLGLRGNERASSNGATIHARFGGDANDFCSGDTVPLRASISTPGNSQAPGLLSIFSIEADGTVWLLERTSRDSFSTEAFFQTPGPGDAREAVLLVASPTTAPLPQAQAPCKLAGTLHPGLIPADAAATLLPYTVHPPARARCGELSVQAQVTLNEIAAFKRAVPECR